MGDALLPVEALLSAVRDFVPVEFGALLRVDPRPPLEAGETVRADPGAPAEAAGGVARADAQVPLESLLLRQGQLVPVEFLSFVRALVVSGDSLTPVEWAALMRRDDIPAVEWAALSASDRNALIEWFRALAVDLGSAGEHRQTNAAPLYFVSGGRIR
jgi:hypothetical protein